MTSIIVKCDLATAKEYTGKSVVAKVGKKKHSVAFRVTADDFTIDEAVELAKRDSNIIMVNYIGSQENIKGVSPNGVYVAWSMEVGNDLTEDDIVKYLAETPEGVSLIVKVPEDYNNIRFLCDMLDKYDNLRICGGSLFCFDGYKFGCCGRDICAMKGVSFSEDSYIHEGCCCAVDIFDLTDVELTASASKGASKGTKKSGSTAKKPSNKVAKFSSLLYGNGKVEL